MGCTGGAVVRTEGISVCHLRPGENEWQGDGVVQGVSEGTLITCLEKLQ